MSRPKIKTEFLQFTGDGILSIDASTLDVYEIFFANTGTRQVSLIPQGFTELPGSATTAATLDNGFTLGARTGQLRLTAGIMVPRSDEYVVKFATGAGTSKLNVFLYGVPKC